MEELQYISKEECKSMLLDIMSDIDNFCKKNNIRYYLWSGSLIGAVRHHGFIPWDDDIDIAMPRPDYERFVNTYVGGVYECIHSRNIRNYPFFFARVHNPQTRLYIPQDKFENCGLCVDIFPLDGMSSNKIIQCIVLKLSALFNGARWIKNRKNTQMVKNKGIKYLCSRLFCILPMQTLHYLQNRITQLFKFESSPCIASLQFPLFHYGDIHNASVLHHSIKCDFEGHVYDIPSGYDEILRNMYGEYMQMPTKSKRVSHNYKVYKLKS